MANTLEITNGMKALAIRQLRELFPDNKYRIFDKPVKQGLKVPAFLVRIVKVGQARLIKRQAQRTFFFALSYFPETKEVDDECLEVLEIIQNNFSYLQKKFHIHEIEGEIVDEVLVITFHVNALVADVVEYTKMQVLEGVYYGANAENEPDSE